MKIPRKLKKEAGKVKRIVIQGLTERYTTFKVKKGEKPNKWTQKLLNAFRREEVKRIKIIQANWYDNVIGADWSIKINRVLTDEEIAEFKKEWINAGSRMYGSFTEADNKPAVRKVIIDLHSHPGIERKLQLEYDGVVIDKEFSEYFKTAKPLESDSNHVIVSRYEYIQIEHTIKPTRDAEIHIFRH